MKNGRGTIWYTNGDKYVGDFIEGAKKGFGVYYFNNDDRYEGAWD